MLNFVLNVESNSQIIAPYAQNAKVFCKKCGGKLIETDLKKETYKYIEKPVVRKSENRNFKIFIGVISGLIAVIIVFLILFYVVGINLTTFKSIVEAEKVEETTQETLKDNTITPDTSANRSLIAFTSDLDGDYEFYVMDSDGSNVVQLTNNNADDI